VQLKNEAKLSDMCHIVEGISEHVPCREVKEDVFVNGEKFSYDCSHLFQLLFFGDQLTVARARGAMTLRSLHPTTLNQLKGCVPTIVDWHSRQCFLKVCIRHDLYLL